MPASSPMTPPEIFWEAPGLCIAGYANTMINLIGASVTLEMLDASHAAHRTLHSRYPSGIGVFSLANSTPPIPDSEVRQRASSIIRQTAGEVLAQVMVIETGGFWGSAARSAVTTINVLARAPNPTKVAASVREGVAWLGRYMEIGDDGSWQTGLEQAVRGVVAQLKPV